MSFLDLLQQATRSLDAQLNVFLLEYRSDGAEVFLFTEGRDDEPFYATCAARALPSSLRIRHVRCCTRKGVLDALVWYRSRFDPNPRALFFIDKDFSDLIGDPDRPADPHLFVTSGYAVENYVAVPATLRRALVEIYGVPDLDPNLHVCVERYQTALGVFAEMIAPVMAWAASARSVGAPVNLSNLRTRDYISVEPDLTVLRAFDESDLAQMLSQQCCAEHLAEDASDWIRRFAELAPDVWIRGKQVMWFFLECLEHLANALNTCGGRLAPNVGLGAKNAVSVLAGRVPTPNDVQAFFDAAWGADAA